MYTDEWRRLNGVWLHFQDWAGPPGGPGRGDLVLLLHGLTQQSHAFDPLAAHLAARYRCVALDFRGRGESDWADGTYTIPYYVADVLALLDALGLDAVHVIGTSLGGLVALSVAGGAPGRLRSLVLNDVGPEIDPRGAARIAAYAGAIPARFPDRDAAAAWARAQYPWLTGRPDDAVAEALRWAVRRGPDGEWRLKVDPAVARAPRLAAEAARAVSQAWWAALEGLRCPALLVRGAESDILAADTAAAMTARQPRLARLDVRGVGHAPTLAEPEVLATLDAFYAQAAPDGAALEGARRGAAKGRC
jgi:pimeloyl-ACP methyl ester carboxylesterase